VQAELDSPVGPPRPRRFRRDCGSRSLRPCRTPSTACPRELAEDAAVPTPVCGFRRYRSTCSGWGPMWNHVEQVPMRAGADQDGRGRSDVRRLHVEAPGMADLNSLLPRSATCTFRSVRRKRSSASVSTGPAQCLSSPAISRTCRSHQTRRGANCPSRRNEDVSGGIPSHGGRTAIVKVIVGSAGCPPNRVPTPAHPAHPSSRPPSPPPSRPQGSTAVAPERQSASMRPIGPESPSAGHDCSQAGEALGWEREPAVVRCMRPIGLYYAQG
jgi:hypothetical protein